MNVGINSLFFIPGKVGGTEIFIRNLIKELSKSKHKAKYYIFANKENFKIFENLPKNFTVIKCPIKAETRLLRILWEQLILPFQTFYYRLNLIHSPGYTTPLFSFCPRITTIFDLNYYYHPEDINVFQRIVYKFIIPLGAYRSNKIIVHTYKAKEEICEVLNVDSKKVIVIYPGVDKVYFRKTSSSKISQVIKQYKIQKGFILANAVSHPHKNLLRLIKAYKLLVTNNFPPLVLLGFSGKQQEVIVDYIKKNEILKDKVLFTGWVDPIKVPYFYKAALLFVFPSLYEGFGLPLIEAMASGVPVLASKYSCIPEVVNNGALVIDVKNISKIRDGIMNLINNVNLRNTIIRTGKKRASDFSWNEFGDKIYNLYLDVV